MEQDKKVKVIGDYTRYKEAILLEEYNILECYTAFDNYLLQLGELEDKSSEGVKFLESMRIAILNLGAKAINSRGVKILQGRDKVEANEDWSGKLNHFFDLLKEYDSARLSPQREKIEKAKRLEIFRFSTSLEQSPRLRLYMASRVVMKFDPYLNGMYEWGEAAFKEQSDQEDKEKERQEKFKSAFERMYGQVYNKFN